MTEDESRRRVVALSEAAFRREMDWAAAYEEAESLLIPFLDGETCESETIATLGAVLSDVGRQLEAYRLLKKLVEERDPGFREAHFNLGVSMMNLSKYRSHARGHFLRAGELPSSDSVLEAHFDPQAH